MPHPPAPACDDCTRYATETAGAPLKDHIVCPHPPTAPAIYSGIHLPIVGIRATDELFKREDILDKIAHEHNNSSDYYDRLSCHFAAHILGFTEQEVQSKFDEP